MQDSLPRTPSKGPLTTERRQNPRHPVRPTEYIEIGDSNGGIILDISEGGMAVASSVFNFRALTKSSKPPAKSIGSEKRKNAQVCASSTFLLPPANKFRNGSIRRLLGTPMAIRNLMVRLWLRHLRKFHRNSRAASSSIKGSRARKQLPPTLIILQKV